jgi:hypothetical protein
MIYANNMPTFCQHYCHQPENDILFNLPLSFQSSTSSYIPALRRPNMLLFIAQCAIVCVVTSACWRFLRFLVVKTDLDNVPGPPSYSFMKGRCCLILWDLYDVNPCRIGNFFKVFATDAWDFHTEIRRKCTTPYHLSY